MLASTVVDLRTRPAWDPAKLLVADFQWPASDPLFALGDLATSVSPDAIAAQGMAVVTPASIDPVSGGIRRRSRRYQGGSFQVGTSLLAGDLLIPSTPLTPVLLVDERLVGALVAAHFRAMRPGPNVSSLWLWAVLNSQTGRAARAAVSAGSTLPSLARSALSTLEVPVPSLAVQGDLAPMLTEIERTTHIEEEEAPQTWWRVSDLRNTKDWYLETSVGDAQLVDGVDLGSLCEQIARGRRVRALAVTEPAEGLVPVTDIPVLGGMGTKHWVPDDPRRLTFAEPGDVFVAAVGDRPHAMPATSRTAVGDRVYVLRLKNRSQAAGLARFLNSTEGFRRRSLFLTRGGAPSFAKRDLERLPIPEKALGDVQPEGLPAQPQVPLADRLEQVLWRR